MIKTIQHGPGGYRAEVYADDDNDSGFGENARIGFWFGTREACKRLDPADVVMYPLSEAPFEPRLRGAYVHLSGDGQGPDVILCEHCIRADGHTAGLDAGDAWRCGCCGATPTAA